MKNKQKERFFYLYFLSVVLFFLIISMGELPANSAIEPFAGGSGTVSDPYLIETKEHLNNVRNDLNAYYKMMNDIVFTEDDFSGGGWNPIGSNTAPFSGTFDGNGYVIENLYIHVEGSSEICVGLFGYLTGIVQNLGLKNLSISVTNISPTSHTYVGSVAGWLYSGAILNCYSDGVISAISLGRITGGGIVGTMMGSASQVESCYFSGELSTSSTNPVRLGGIVGGMSGTSSIVKNSFNLGYIISRDSDQAYTGGIVGSFVSGSVSNVYNVGIVCGKIAGYVENGTINNAYYLNSSLDSAGEGEESSVKCSWDQMKEKDTFAGFDFDSVWHLDSSLDYPCPMLQNLPIPSWNFEENTTEFAGGTGVPWDPYLIESSNQLNCIRNHLTAYYKLCNNISFSNAASEISWNPIGTSINDAFSGCFDGNGYVIENLRININGSSSICGGLFGYNIGTIQNLGLVNANITAVTTNLYSYVGGIAGWSSGEIENCYFAGTISGSFVGGIVGSLSSGRVSQCYNVGCASGYRGSGGVAGYFSSGTIEDCYNAGIVSSSLGESGAIVGHSFGDVVNCYYLESMPNGMGLGVDSCTKCTTAQMMQQSSFSGFDFERVWTMDGNSDYLYPELQSVSLRFEKRVASLEVIATPTKLSYLEGESFNPSGMMVVLRYNNGQTEPVNDYSISGFSNTPGIKTITVSKDELIAQFSVKVHQKSLTSINVTAFPKLNYTKGEPFDASGMIVTAYYDNNTTETVTDYVVSGYTSTIGTKTITVTYQEKTTDFTVTVKEKALISIAVTQLPSKIIYLEGESFKKSGMIVTAYYDNDTSKIITDYDITGYTSTPGLKTLTVVYKGLSTTLTVTVNAKTLESIKVIKKPNKSTYVEGESFDPTGMIVKAYYNNDTSEEIIDYTYDGYTSTPGTKTMTVSFGGKTATFTIVVSEKSLLSIQVTTKPKKLIYLEDSLFDPAGMVVTAYYNNGTSETVTDYTIRGFTSNPGIKEITVSYQRKTARFSVTVNAKNLTSIAVTKLPNKATYFVGDSFNKAGMVVMAYYDNGASAKITDYTILGNLATIGENTITLSYGGKSTSLIVTVKPKVPSSITSDQHTVNGKNISKITLGTPINTFLANLNEGVFCRVYNDTTEMAKDKLIGTGMTVKIMDGDEVKKSYTAIITGDVNGDGLISITDLISVKAHLLKKSALSGVYATAADINGDGGISITDFIQIKAKILKKGDIIPR